MSTWFNRYGRIVVGVYVVIVTALVIVSLFQLGVALGVCS